MSGDERGFIAEAFASNYVTPLGPQVDAFQLEFATLAGTPHALALSSGTAALHLALQLVGVSAGDDVLISTLTFAASAYPISYLGARPVFVDSERKSWNMDPAILAQTLRDRARSGRLPAAVVVVHLYGQSADLDPIVTACTEYDVSLIEDAAEALGATGRVSRPVSSAGSCDTLFPVGQERHDREARIQARECADTRWGGAVEREELQLRAASWVWKGEDARKLRADRDVHGRTFL